ncbi:hypothetical protein L596_006520 [Steinernema carpocapsae]|uniref:Uncharacterized protein n=1 Tax=Steinernema carpocapsae TaxID=34508 RepID=A0A4U8V9G6_STECR|nr:hypothetical protein L596_006520 [Steinernema carpocapsae]
MSTFKVVIVSPCESKSRPEYMKGPKDIDPADLQRKHSVTEFSRLKVEGKRALSQKNEFEQPEQVKDETPRPPPPSPQQPESPAQLKSESEVNPPPPSLVASKPKRTLETPKSLDYSRKIIHQYAAEEVKIVGMTCRSCRSHRVGMQLKTPSSDQKCDSSTQASTSTRPRSPLTYDAEYKKPRMSTMATQT